MKLFHFNYTRKYILTLVTLLFMCQSYAQTKKGIISDDEYNSFFNGIRYTLNTNRIELKSMNCLESVLDSNYSYEGKWQNFFSKEDIKFQRKQIKALGKRDIEIHLLDSIKVISKQEIKKLKDSDSLSENTAYYTIGYPIFSVDKKLAGIWIKYNCGMYCSEQKLIIYKNDNNRWIEYKTLFHVKW